MCTHNLGHYTGTRDLRCASWSNSSAALSLDCHAPALTHLPTPHDCGCLAEHTEEPTCRESLPTDARLALMHNV
ncbi:hypothetical protein NDU88_004683 [Pleurodeles waltl]|uniref:Uncharacterized protein n=1 Tax=Pleurodeles waltl TaxID=8319 RepID=A0AAV7KYH3_PLEWA|nr:hypothetical protein NDU88_004683 [Pleurodeles waltl]